MILPPLIHSKLLRVSAAGFVAATAALIGWTGTGKAGEPPFQLPWPTGVSHYIAWNSYTYGGSTHTGSDAYAVDRRTG